MEVIIAEDGALKEKLEQLLYAEMWEPYGMDKETRRHLAISGEEIGFVCVDGEEVIGAMVLYVNGGTADLRLAAVASHRRREGIGQRLWKHIVQYMTSRPAIAMVELHARNTAIEFWSSLGFIEQSDWLAHKLYESHGIKFKRMTYHL